MGISLCVEPCVIWNNASDSVFVCPRNILKTLSQISTLRLNLTLKVKVNHPQNDMDLHHGLLHLWSKFGDPSLNGWWVIARTSWGLTHTHGHTQTDAGNNNTRRPKLASGKNRFPFFRCNHISDNDYEWDWLQNVWNCQLLYIYIMAGHAIVVVKDIILLSYHGNAVILTLQ